MNAAGPWPRGTSPHLAIADRLFSASAVPATSVAPASLQPGLRGPYLHAKVQWQYGPAGERVRTPLHRITTCLLGHHHYLTAWRRNGDKWVFMHRRCAWCQRDDPELITHERIQ